MGKVSCPFFIRKRNMNITFIRYFSYKYKKADVLANIGVQFPKSICDTVVCFNDIIAYFKENVK